MTPSRRDFVATLLGVPASLASCQKAPVALPGGELLQPGKHAGHRIRDQLRPSTGLPPIAAPTRWLETEVAIVGGGVAGLAASWWLRRNGVHDLMVLEADNAPGGTSRSGQSGFTSYPWGAHYVVAPSARQPVLSQLLAEMGALEPDSTLAAPKAAEHRLCREPQERVFYLGRWYSGLYLSAGASREDRRQLDAFQREIDRWVAFRDASGNRAFDLPARRGSDCAEVRALDKLSFAGWLDSRGLKSPRLRWLTDYACRDDYGLLARDTSAWAGVAYFACRTDQPGETPRPVVTWPEGNDRLAQQLGLGLGPRLRLQHPVSRVDETTDGQGVNLTALTPDGPRGVRARHVVVATPLFVAQGIVGPLKRGQRPRVETDRGAWAVANLQLSGRPRKRASDAPLSWDNVIRDSPSLGYVVATHQEGRDYGPTVLTWYYPFTGDATRARRELDSASREDWAAAALADMARAHPDLPKLCERIDIAYWGHGMVRPRPGTVFDSALQAARKPLGRLHFAVSELSGVSLFEEALDHGVRAAREVLERRRSRT